MKGLAAVLAFALCVPAVVAAPTAGALAPREISDECSMVFACIDGYGAGSSATRQAGSTAAMSRNNADIQQQCAMSGTADKAAGRAAKADGGYVNRETRAPGAACPRGRTGQYCEGYAEGRQDGYNAAYNSVLRSTCVRSYNAAYQAAAPTGSPTAAPTAQPSKRMARARRALAKAAAVIARHAEPW